MTHSNENIGDQRQITMTLTNVVLKSLLYGLTVMWLCNPVNQAYSIRKSHENIELSKSSLIRQAFLASSKSPPLSPQNIYKKKGFTKPGDNFEVIIDTTGVTVWLEGEEIYSIHNITRFWDNEIRRFHAGVHVIVLHERSLKILQTGNFVTWQPASHRMLASMLKEIQDGRIVIVLGVPEYVAWLLEDAALGLLELDANMGVLAIQGEAWLMVTRKGHHAIFETLITSRNSTSKDVSPLWFSAAIPTFKERRCAWYQNPEMVDRAHFCETYEGYGDFCHCTSPLMISPKNAPPLSKTYETIPVALVTAKRLPKVLKQIAQIWSNPGGDITPITIMVDGYNPEAELLAKILNISILFHNNTVEVGTKHRVNQHIKFSLASIFEQHPNVDKAIILEDDLVLAPDIISFFHQAAIIMKFDPTVICVNAYNYNSYPHTAHDPTRLYRAQSYPYYGWMTRRSQARKMMRNWAPLDTDADWDLWIRKHHVNARHQVIIPEVPRTKHLGGGGVHVSGYEQEVTFQQRPLNTEQNVTLNLRRLWDFAYGLDLMRTIEHAVVVNITQHPCIKIPVPKYDKRTHVIYLNLTGEDDATHTFFVLAKCMGFYKFLYENYQGTVSIKFFKTPVVIVSCPSSGYCVDVPKSVIYQPTLEDVAYSIKRPFRLTNVTGELSWRVPATDPVDEFNLMNTGTSYFVVNE